jgi:hypothetical protein
MGHLTIVDRDIEKAIEKSERAKKILKAIAVKGDNNEK